MVGRHLIALVLTAALAGCLAPGAPVGRDCVSASLAERAGHALGPPADPCEVTLPPGVEDADGLSEDEAVAVALWNSAGYQEALADLGLTRADLIQARQLTNPDFSVLFPVGVKQLEFWLNAPLEAFWLRPRRTAAAEIESRRVGQRLVQEGLNLIRDVRVGYADLLAAQDRLRLAEESSRVYGEIARLAEARRKAGAASALDAATAAIDGLLEVEQVSRASRDVEIAAARLRLLLGIQRSSARLEPLHARPRAALEANVEALIDEALGSRPDLLAARLAVEAASQRAALARYDYFQLAATLPDVNGRGKKGFEAGPGLKFTVPIFHQNQGAIARADAEVERARRHYAALANQAILEIEEAHARFVEADGALGRWDATIVPAAEEAVARSEKAYRDGGVTLLLVLENSRQAVAARTRRTEAQAERRRAAAELERAVARRLFGEESSP